MNILQAIILSIVEGLTEFLPISSTAHLVLASQILHISQTNFVKTFEIAIQLGAILSVAIFYWKTLLSNKSLIKNILIAFLPTAIVGLVLYKFIKSYLLGNIYVTLAALFLGGIFIILFEKFFKNKKTKNLNSLTIKDNILIGIFQSISIVPGVSRSAASIFGGMIVGLDRSDATQFSFLLAFPTLFAATGLDLVKNIKTFNGQNIEILLIGFVGAFVVSYLTIKFLLDFVKQNNFVMFGVYRIVLALVFFAFMRA